jgi:hypothetical protein
MPGQPSPAVVLSYDPPGPQFPISEQCVMPSITATATLQNITAPSAASLQFRWTVTLVFTGNDCVHSLFRKISHPDITQTTSTNKFTIPFTAIRGGDLTIGVTVTVGKVTLTAQSKSLRIVGTNPSIGALQAVTPNNDAFKKLMRYESDLKQFLSPSCPHFSEDNQGGVGICQLTDPPPNPDQVWSWKANLNAGWALYKKKETTARNYPEVVRKSADFLAKVKAYNDQRAAKATKGATVKPLAIELPDYDDDQLQRDTLRGFNGYAGGLHEYRVKVDKDGILVITENASGTKGTAQWEVITAAERIAYYDKINLDKRKRGDPNYVDSVETQASF